MIYMHNYLIGQLIYLFFQWLLQTPNATSFFGCVSKDKFGRLLEDKARESGVNVQFQFTDKEPTGTCGVIVTGDKR